MVFLVICGKNLRITTDHQIFVWHEGPSSKAHIIHAGTSQVCVQAFDASALHTFMCHTTVHLGWPCMLMTQPDAELILAAYLLHSTFKPASIQIGILRMLVTGEKTDSSTSIKRKPT